MSLWDLRWKSFRKPYQKAIRSGKRCEKLPGRIKLHYWSRNRKTNNWNSSWKTTWLKINYFLRFKKMINPCEIAYWSLKGSYLKKKTDLNPETLNTKRRRRFWRLSETDRKWPIITGKNNFCWKRRKFRIRFTNLGRNISKPWLIWRKCSNKLKIKL